MRAVKWVGSAAIVGLTLACGFGAAAEPFTLTSASFKDGDMLAAKNGGNIKSNPNCLGENISPDLKWSGAPATAKSFALVMSDWEGQSGLGAHHLVVYGIVPQVAGFAEGELSKASDKFVGGKGTAGTTVYRGPCTPPGIGIHHYVFTVIATDLEPGALPAGLTRPELFDKLNGHGKGAAGLIGLFKNPL